MSDFDGAERAERMRQSADRASIDSAPEDAGTTKKPDAAAASGRGGSAGHAGSAGGGGAGRVADDTDAGAIEAPRAGRGGAGAPAPAAGRDADPGAAGAAGTSIMGAAGSTSEPSPCGDTKSQVDNCGSCGNSCAASSALVSCVDSSCVRVCQTNYADCNGDLSFGAKGDGCETDVQADAKNCGGCNLKCDAFWGEVAGCENRRCVLLHASVAAAAAVGTGLHGSSDGGDAYEQVCGRDQVLVGIDYAGTTEYVYGFAALCAQLLVSGAPSHLIITPGDINAFPLLGNKVTPAGPTQRLQCPEGSIVTSVSGAIAFGGMNDTLPTIKQLGLSCSQIMLDGQTVQLSPGGLLSAGSTSGAIDTFVDACPPGAAVVGFNGRSGALIDALQTQCASFSVAHNPTVNRAEAMQ